MAYNVRRRPLSREKAFLCRTGRGIPHPYPIGVLLFARPGVGAVTLALLFGLYSLIYGFSQITVGIQIRHLGGLVNLLSELRHAA